MVTWQTIRGLWLVPATVLLLAAAGVRAQDSTMLLDEVHKQAGVSCGACHVEQPPAVAPPHRTCMGCHGNADELAALTADLVPNPHVSPHLPEDTMQNCIECHHIHAPEEVTCIACHKVLERRLQERRTGESQ